MLLVFVERDSGGFLLTVGGDGDALEGDLDGVQGDAIAGLGEGHIDRFDAGEGRGLDVGGEGERVVLGADGLGKTLGVRGAGCGCDQAEKRECDERHGKTRAFSV